VFDPDFDPYDRLVGLEQEVLELRRNFFLRDQQILQLVSQQNHLITLIRQLRLELDRVKNSD
jgi:hypothetical protein